MRTGFTGPLCVFYQQLGKHLVVNVFRRGRCMQMRLPKQYLESGVGKCLKQVFVGQLQSQFAFKVLNSSNSLLPSLLR